LTICSRKTDNFSIIGSSIYTPGFADVKKDFHIATAAAFLPFTLYVLGLAFGPVIAAPISETFGRRIVYLTTFPLTMVFTLGSGFAQNFGTLLVCRLFAGMFCVPSLAVGAGSISDMYHPIDRAVASGLWMLLAFLGPVMGPPIASYASMNKGMLAYKLF
jgi:MFS family permease